MELSFKFSTGRLLEYLILSICLGLFFLTNLGVEPVELWDESTNINVVRETLDEGNFLDLQYNGEPFWEKTPLWYVGTASLVEIFGEHVAVYRGLSAVSGVLFGLGIFYLLRKYHSKLAGYLGVAVFLSIPHLHFFSNKFFSTHTFRTADLDALQLVLMLYASIFFLEYLAKKNKRAFYLGTVLSALAFITKGPFGVLPILVTILTSLIANKNSLINELKKKEYWIGLGIFLLVIMPWHLYMLALYGREFFDEYMMKHLLFRSFSQIDGHEHNLLYYFKILAHPAVFLPLELLIISFVRFVKSNQSKYLKNYLVLLGVISFVIIEIVQTKLAWYLFYFYLPLIPIMGIGLAEVIRSQKIHKFEVVLLGFLLIRILLYITLFSR
jgi:4-amino-4-deoxy-L-arabinose transferase-like glycosyltransferase